MDNTTRNTVTTVGFVLAIICLVVDVFTILIGSVAAINILLAIPTIILGVNALKKNSTGKSKSIVIIGVITLLIGILWLFI